MALKFHDGTLALYSGYCGGRAWNDADLLRLNPGDAYDKWVMDTYNTEAGMRALFDRPGILSARPFGPGTSTVGEYVGGDGASLIVIKGLHQWQEIRVTPKGGRPYWQKKLHVTVGLEGQLWHFYGTLHDHSDPARAKVALSPQTISVGERMTGTDHDNFQRVTRR